MIIYEIAGVYCIIVSVPIRDIFTICQISGTRYPMERYHSSLWVNDRELNIIPNTEAITRIVRRTRVSVSLAKNQTAEEAPL